MADPLHDRPDDKARRERDPEKAVNQMERLLENQGRGSDEGPPMREEYGGPRKATDGTSVEPDGAEPELPTDASAREGTPPAGHQGDKEDAPAPDKTPGQGGPL